MRHWINLIAAFFVITICCAPSLPNESWEDKVQIFFRQTRTAAFNFDKTERFGDDLVQSKSVIHYQSQPLNILIYNLEPMGGVNIKYSGNTPLQALIQSRMMKSLKTDLDIYGSVMLRKQHHPVNHLRLDYFGNIILSYFREMKSGNAIFKSEKTANGYKLHFKIKQFVFKELQVKKAKQLDSFAIDRNLSTYLIIEKNEDKNARHNSDMLPKSIWKIPSHYAEEMMIEVAEDFSPQVLGFFIDGKVYEYYRFSDLQINPTEKPAFDF